MGSFIRIVAAAVVSVGLMVTGTQAAEMPSAKTSAEALTGGFSVALPKLAANDAANSGEPIKVAGRRFRRGVAVGLGILGIAAIVAASEARARRRSHHYEPRRVHRRASPRRTCSRWLRHCDRGNYRACDKYDAYCY